MLRDQDNAEHRAAAAKFFAKRPALSPKSERYYADWLSLGRYRPFLSHGLGMAGGMLLRQVLPRETIEAEGARLGYIGDGLDDFVELMTRFGALEFRADLKRQAKEFAAAQKKNTKPPAFG